MNVLIAEDEIVSSMVLRQNLQKMGYDVISATNGNEAWMLYQAEPVKLVITDWMMPVMDGIELCKLIRGSGTPYTYIILLTAKDRKEDKINGLESGADDFMLKPLDQRDLEARLNVALRILEMQEQLQRYSKEQELMREEAEIQNAQLQEALKYSKEANHRFSELFMGLPIACFAFDSEGRIREWNRTCEDLYGFTADKVYERRFWEVIGRPNDYKIYQLMNAKVFKGFKYEGMEMTVVRHDGQMRQILQNTFPLHGPSDEILGAISAGIDITERKYLEKQLADQLQIEKKLSQKLDQQRSELAAANARLSRLVITDGLTGLKNHRYFREQLEQAFSHSRRNHTPFSVIMLDVDKFKEYNDTYGHMAGDEALIAIAHVMEKSVRNYDITARYGGEEFAILLPSTDGKDAMFIAERLRHCIQSYPWPKRTVTASIGVSTYMDDKEDPNQIVDEADKALYFSKRNGRNRVSHYDINSVEMKDTE
jgi:two-component system cell cycle response regulator